MARTPIFSHFEEVLDHTTGGRRLVRMHFAASTSSASQTYSTHTYLLACDTHTLSTIYKIQCVLSLFAHKQSLHGAVTIRAYDKEVK